MTRNMRLIIALACLAISSLGDDMQAMAIVFKLRTISQDPYLLPLLFSVQLGSGVLAYRLVSSFPERYGVRRVAAISSTVLALLALSYPLLETPAQLIAAASVVSSVSAALTTSVFLMVPLAAKVFGHEASRGNAVAEGLNSASAVIGPPLCGFIVVSGYLELAFIVNAATFAVLIVGLMVVGPLVLEKGEVRTVSVPPKRVFPRLGLLMLALGAVALSTAVSDIVFILLVEHTFSGSALVYGGSTAAWSLGLIAAAAWAMKRSHSGLLFAFIGAIGMGASLFMVAAVGWISAPAAIALLVSLFFIGGVFNGLHNISVRTFITDSFDPGQRGKVYGMYAAYCRIGILSGYWIGSLLAREAVHMAYAASGAFAVLVGTVGVSLIVLGMPHRRKVA